MMVSNHGSFLRVLVWQWRYTLVYLGLGALAFICHNVLDAQHLRLPTAPATVIGAALGIFASFRANAAYARWWEGRQLWGKLVNASRMFSSQVTAYVPDAALVRTALTRHALYVHVLRCQLRDDDPFADADVARLITRLGLDDTARARLKGESSVCHALADENLRALAQSGVDPLRLQSMDTTVAAILDVQGGCERIKRTPLPRGYSFFVSRLMIIFAALFPFAVVHEVGLFVVPLNLFVCIGFTLISETGRVLEDPFNHFWNSLPLSALSITIERNVRQRLGDDDLPAPVVVDRNGILW